MRGRIGGTMTASSGAPAMTSAPCASARWRPPRISSSDRFLAKSRAHVELPSANWPAGSQYEMASNSTRPLTSSPTQRHMASAPVARWPSRTRIDQPSRRVGEPRSSTDRTTERITSDWPANASLRRSRGGAIVRAYVTPVHGDGSTAAHNAMKQFRSAAQKICSPGIPLACWTQAVNWGSSMASSSWMWK